MVTRLLNLSGLYLGEEGQIMLAGQGNPEGFWEHRGLIDINDGVLSELGGGWDFPPVFQDGWENLPALDPWRAKASEMIAGLRNHAVWGW